MEMQEFLGIVLGCMLLFQVILWISSITLAFYCQVVKKDMEITWESVCYANYGCINPPEKFSMAWSQPYSTSHEY